MAGLHQEKMYSRYSGISPKIILVINIVPEFKFEKLAIWTSRQEMIGKSSLINIQTLNLTKHWTKLAHNILDLHISKNLIPEPTPI